jgi:hypothetical protein
MKREAPSSLSPSSPSKKAAGKPSITDKASSENPEEEHKADANAAAETMKLLVLFFATARVATGVKELNNFSLPVGSTTDDFITAATKRFPRLGKGLLAIKLHNMPQVIFFPPALPHIVMTSAAIAVNQEYATPGQVLKVRPTVCHCVVLRD